MTISSHQACTLPYPDRFHAAVNFIVNNTPGSKAIPDELRLVLYALHQQATVGPCTEAKPWGWNVVESAKWESWNQLGNMSSVEAMRLYVKMVEDDQPNWWALAKAHQQKLSAMAESREADSAEGGYFASPALEAAPLGVWSAPYVEGPKRPPPRYEHASAAIGLQLYIFGGNCGGRYLGDMWILHLDSLTWEAVSPKAAAAEPAENGHSAPPQALAPSAGHAMAAWGSKLLIVGGHMKATAAGRQMRIACFDTEADSLAMLEPSGTLIASRGGHSASVVNGSLYVFGGEDSSRRPVSELHVLDLATMAWQQVQTTGRAPAARSAHAAIVYKNRFLIIFGGGSVAACYNDVVMLDTKTLEWSSPATTGAPPTPRAGHAAALLADTLFIVGGGNNSAGCADLAALDLGGLGTGQPLTWSTVAKAETRSPIASEGLSLTAVRSAGALLAFGGYNGKYHNSAQVYRPGVVAPKPAQEADPVPVASQGGQQKEEAATKSSSAKAEANGDAGQKDRKQDSGHVTPSKGVAAKAPGKQIEDMKTVAKEELASMRRDAAAAKEASAAELALMRRQLASAESAAADVEAALADTEKKLLAAAKENDEQQSQIFRLEVRLAEANKKLEHTADLEKELLHYRKLAKDAEKKGQGGLWGYISGS